MWLATETSLNLSDATDTFGWYFQLQNLNAIFRWYWSFTVVKPTSTFIFAVSVVFCICTVRLQGVVGTNGKVAKV